MPMPPPRLSSSISIPCSSQMRWASEHDACGRDLEARRVEDLRADVRVQAHEVQARAASRCGARPRRPRPTDTDSPNFWSSCAVAMNSWVCASTPTVTRTSTGCTTPARAAASAMRTTSSKESMTMRPTPAATAASISAIDLLLPCSRRRSPGTPARSATASSPPDAHVDAEALLRDPARDRRSSGTPWPRSRRAARLRRRRSRGSDGPGRAGRPRRRGTAASRARPTASRTSTPAISMAPSAFRRQEVGPHRRRQPVHLLRGRRPGGRVVQGEAVGVQGSSGMGAHAERLGHRRTPTSDPVR